MVHVLADAWDNNTFEHFPERENVIGKVIHHLVSLTLHGQYRGLYSLRSLEHLLEQVKKNNNEKDAEFLSAAIEFLKEKENV